MYLTVKGLVMRVTNYNDHDALLTVLTQNNGKLTMKARGLRRKNSPLIAPCQLLAYSEFVLFENKGFYTINEAHTVSLFHGLRNNLQKLYLGFYFSQVIDVLSQEDSPNPELLRLILNTLHVLSSTDTKELLIKAVFEFRCACIAGFMPDLNGCSRCGGDLPDRFDVSTGLMECAGCRGPESDGIRMPISPSVLTALRYIASCDPKKLFSFTVGDESLLNLSRVTELYLTTQLERGFSALDFYKSLLI